MKLFVPAIFWDDHCDRFPCDDESDMAAEVSRSGNRALIEGSTKQIECLRSDAEYYCDIHGPDKTPPSIKRSAAATLKAIAKCLP